MYEKYPELIFKSETVDRIGKIENVVGMSIEASGGTFRSWRYCHDL